MMERYTSAYLNKKSFPELTALATYTIQRIEAKQPLTNGNLNKLTPIDRKHLIAGLVGEYEYLCHDDAEDGDMTPAEHYAKLITYSDAGLLEDSDLIDSHYVNTEDFYDAFSTYCPPEYWVEKLLPELDARYFI